MTAIPANDSEIRSATQAADADESSAFLVGLYDQHYLDLLRLAVLCVDNRALAEDIVQDAFISVYQVRHRLDRSESPLGYLRKAVLNRARSRLRHRKVVLRYQPQLATSGVEPDHGDQAENRALLRSALARLPPRQREAVVLRHYADLSEKQAAEVMGVGVGAVKAHCSRGLAALEHILREMDR